MTISSSTARPAPVAALCERVVQAARQAGEEALRARQAEAVQIRTEAHRRAEAESEQELRKAQKRLKQQIEREFQNARLDARAQLCRARWTELDAVLAEAVRRIAVLRDSDPVRCGEALYRLLRDSQRHLADRRLVVKVHPQDEPSLRARLQEADARELGERILEVQPAEIEAGVLAATPEGDVVVDATIRQRCTRLDAALRLAAAEALWDSTSDPR